ncbi:hypothetical protein ACWIUH_05375 [Ursidibacter arcticus]
MNSKHCLVLKSILTPSSLPEKFREEVLRSAKAVAVYEENV